MALLHLNIYGHHGDRLVVGFGVQWAPDTRRGEDNPAATLQLCISRRCLIFQLIHADNVPKMLRRFLSNPDVTFVGFWIFNVNYARTKRCGKVGRKDVGRYLYIAGSFS